MGENRGAVVLALILIGLGALFLVGQVLGGAFWGLAWPFFVIIPGLLFFVGMIFAGKGSGGLAIPGSIITMTGAILFYQNLFGHWESWAYVWALIFPLSLGIGLMINGIWSNQPSSLEVGKRMVLAGVIVFLVAAAFFEGVIGLSGFFVSRVFWPLLLIVAGVLMLLRGALGAQKGKGSEEPATPSPFGPRHGEE